MVDLRSFASPVLKQFHINRYNHAISGDGSHWGRTISHSTLHHQSFLESSLTEGYGSSLSQCQTVGFSRRSNRCVSDSFENSLFADLGRSLSCVERIPDVCAGNADESVSFVVCFGAPFQESEQLRLQLVLVHPSRI